jgi:hypothetical protein
MGFRFRRSFKIAPGVRLNMGRSGFTSMSVGPRGLKMNVGARGVRTTVGIPGTGISYTTSTATGRRTAHNQVPLNAASIQMGVRVKPHDSHKVLKTAGTLLLALVVAAAVHPVVGLLVGIVLLWLTLRSGKHTPAPLVASAPVSALVSAEPPQLTLRAAPSHHALERLRLTAATKLVSDTAGGSKRVGQLQAGCDVTVLSRRPGWMFIQAESGVEGWARDQNWTALPR